MKKTKGQSGTYISSSERSLVRINTVTWKAESVYNLNTKGKISAGKVIGCYDNYFVLERTIYDHEITGEEKAKEMCWQKLREGN